MLLSHTHWNDIGNAYATHSAIPVCARERECSCFNQRERTDEGRWRPSAPPSAGAATAAEAAVFCLPTAPARRDRYVAGERERERGNITRLSAPDQIPTRDSIQLDADYDWALTRSGSRRRTRGEARFCRRNCRNEQKDGGKGM